MQTIDFSPLFRSTIGFDRLASLLDATAQQTEQAPAYPPYSIEKLGEDAYRISMAVAGFARQDLSIEVNANTLTISGKQPAEQGGKDRKFLHRGIATRNFERRFQLADHMKVTGAELTNGLLHVDVMREIPEAMKPRRIEILGGGNDGNVIEGKAA